MLLDGKYRVMVSDAGHIYNMRGREYYPDINIKGYSRVGLSVTINGKTERHRYFVHRLVATAFIPNPHNLPQVNHIDLCKSNNSVENLEWCDQSHNMLHANRLRRAGIKPIQEIRNTQKTAADYLNNREWTNFLKSLPLGETKWYCADANELLIIRNTATYLTRTNKALRFSVHKYIPGGHSFIVTKSNNHNGNA